MESKKEKTTEHKLLEQKHDFATFLTSDKCKASKRISKQTQEELSQSVEANAEHRAALSREERMQYDFSQAMDFGQLSIDRYHTWCKKYDADEGSDGN